VFEINVLQGSVATHFKYSEISNNCNITNFSMGLQRENLDNLSTFSELWRPIYEVPSCYGLQ